MNVCLCMCVARLCAYVCAYVHRWLCVCVDPVSPHWPVVTIPAVLWPGDERDAMFLRHAVDAGPRKPEAAGRR